MKKVHFTVDDVQEMLRSIATEEGDGIKAAQKLGISDAYFYLVVNGKRNPGPKILKKLGLRKQILYIHEIEL